MKKAALAFVILVYPIWAFAVDPSLKDFPRSGLLAVAGDSIYGGGVALPPMLATKPGETPAIGGSVARAQDGAWRFTVYNNSKLSLSIGVALTQYGAHGVRLGSQAFTYSLKSGESKTETISNKAGAVTCTLELTDWKEEKR